MQTACQMLQVFTSDHALKLDWIPKWIAIIGSGYIGLEFSDVYTALGSEVTFIEAGVPHFCIRQTSPSAWQAVPSKTSCTVHPSAASDSCKAKSRPLQPGFFKAPALPALSNDAQQPIVLAVGERLTW